MSAIGSVARKFESRIRTETDPRLVVEIFVEIMESFEVSNDFQVYVLESGLGISKESDEIIHVFLKERK